MAQGNILLVDDTPANLELLLEILMKQGYKVRCAISGPLAIKAVEAMPPDVILLDVNMPDMDGYTVCQTLKQNPKFKDIPVLFVSALGETLDKVKAFQVGGVDYVTKPFHIEEVLARIQTHLALRAAQFEVKVLNTKLEQRVVERTAQLQKEMTKRQHIQEKLLYRATHDGLTGLLNRPGFVRELKQAVKLGSGQISHDPHGSTQMGSSYAIVTLACDRFQQIINAFGHLASDRLLTQIANRLEVGLAQDTVVARLGGEHFAILFRALDVGDREACQGILMEAKRLQASLSKPFQLEQRELFLQTKCGVVFGQPHYQNVDHILRDVDIACYWAKPQGQISPVAGSTGEVSESYCVFDNQMHHQALNRIELEGDLRLAIERRELTLQYQPLIALESGELAGLEALVRWKHPEQGMISPAQFIPVAEASGLIVPLGFMVLRQACEQLRAWQAQYPLAQSLKMSVNLSVRQFAQPDLVEQIEQTLVETGLRPQNLKLEITESAIMDNAELAAAILGQLRSRQIQLAIDDFGTGYSSLSYLNQFPVDTLKIDRSFVSQLDQDPKQMGILKAITTLAHTLDMDIVAEGIETELQLKQLRSFGCQFGQGYFFSKPVDASTMEQLFQAPVWQMPGEVLHAVAS